MLREKQAGFRIERSTEEQIASLRIILEQSNEWNSPVPKAGRIIMQSVYGTVLMAPFVCEKIVPYVSKYEGRPISNLPKYERTTVDT